MAEALNRLAPAFNRRRSVVGIDDYIEFARFAGWTQTRADNVAAVIDLLMARLVHR
jgi:hypothetical protein